MKGFPVRMAAGRSWFVILRKKRYFCTHKKITQMATTADIKIGITGLPGSGKTYAFTAGVAIEPVRVERRPYQYLYEDDMGCNFMHTETFEQIIINRDLIDNSDLMKEGQVVEVMFHTEKETVLSAELPPIIDMEVTYTEPGVKGDTASTNSLKPATVETGATIKVPLFIQTGEKIRVDTRTREYYERIK